MTVPWVVRVALALHDLERARYEALVTALLALDAADRKMAA